MNSLDAIKQSQSATFKKKNPHIFADVGNMNIGGEDDAEHDHIAALTAKQKPKKRIRQSNAPLLNKLEGDFQKILLLRYPDQDMHVTAQAIRFALGNGIAYKPDFVVFVRHRCPIAYECKGPHSYRGGFENLKVAANKYPCVNFVLTWKDKETGQWQEQHVLP